MLIAFRSVSDRGCSRINRPAFEKKAAARRGDPSSRGLVIGISLRTSPLARPPAKQIMLRMRHELQQAARATPNFAPQASTLTDPLQSDILQCAPGP